MIFDIDFETMPREALEEIQFKRLQSTLERVHATVPFYQKNFMAAGIAPTDIKSLEELQNVPFTTKQDLLSSDLYGLFAVPMDNIVRIHISSGTKEHPNVMGYTNRDINQWAILMARALMAGGTTRGDVIHNAYTYGMFTGGLGFHYGAEKVGASVIPVSDRNPKRQIHIMNHFKPTILASAPSSALRLIEVAKEMNIDISEMKFKAGIFGTEPWSENTRKTIEAELKLSAVDIYSIGEVMGPGIAIECHEAKNGLHIFEDHFIAEIIDPESGKRLPPGERGELVLTTIMKEGLPLIRYRTGDLTSINPEPCVCGRTHVRINRINERVDEMLSIRGISFYPSQIEHILSKFDGILPHYQLIVERNKQLDMLAIHIEVNEDLFTDDVRSLQILEQKLTMDLEEFLDVPATVRLVERKSIERKEGQIIRVIDRREI